MRSRYYYDFYVLTVLGGDVMDLMDLITNLGFPSAVAIFALWNSSKHEEFLQNTLRETIAENTRALQELKETISKLGGGKNDIRRSEKED